MNDTEFYILKLLNDGDATRRDIKIMSVVANFDLNGVDDALTSLLNDQYIELYVGDGRYGPTKFFKLSLNGLWIYFLKNKDEVQKNIH